MLALVYKPLMNLLAVFIFYLINTDSCLSPVKINVYFLENEVGTNVLLFFSFHIYREVENTKPNSIASHIFKTVQDMKPL